MKTSLYFCVLFGLIAASRAEDVDPANDPRNIERPCYNFNLDCIRWYIWRNSQCQIAEGPVPDPLHLDNYKLDIANANVTMDFHDVEVEGLNGNIVEFYVNHVTRKLVLAFEVMNLTLHSPDTMISYNKKCQEPIQRRDFVAVDYGRITFTVIFDNFEYLDLKNANVYTYIENSNPHYTIGPNLPPDSDSTARKEFRKLVSNLPDDLREVFVVQGKIFMSHVIQSSICDFQSEIV